MNAVVSTLDARRAKALDSFRAKGVPHRRVEEWKYSDLRNVVSVQDVEDAGGAGYSESVPASVERLDLSPEGVMPNWAILRLNSVKYASAMDAAAWGLAGGSVLRVPANTHLENPLELNLFTPGHAHVILLVEANASLTLLETHHVRQDSLQNVSLTIFLDSGARLNHVRKAMFAPDLLSVETITIIQKAGSRYRAHFANFGAKLSRTEVHVALEGEGAEAHLSGISVLDEAHADITTHVTHAVGNTRSTQLFKKVARGKSRGIYQGKVTVAQGANGSDSQQTAKGLLLSERAEIDLKPELEIFADDVKCAHGAAVGDLDLESLFYLQSRGIPETEARSLLIRAFLGDAIDEVENEDIRATIWNTVDVALENML